jgi:hypothetical protein
MYTVTVIVVKRVDEEGGVMIPWRRMRSRLWTTN